MAAQLSCHHPCPINQQLQPKSQSMTKPSTASTQAEHPSIRKGNSLVCSCRGAAPARRDAAWPLRSHPSSTERSAELPAGAEITVVGQISPLLTNTSTLVYRCPLARSPAATQLNQQVFYPPAQLHPRSRMHRTASLLNIVTSRAEQGPDPRGNITPARNKAMIPRLRQDHPLSKDPGSPRSR